MTKPWSHLPNAALIDRILADLRARPEAWEAAWDAAHVAVSVAAWVAARDAAWVAGRRAEWAAAWEAAYDAARDEVWEAAHNAARDAIMALIAYDDCAKYLKMTPDELRVWYQLSEHPACLLFIPAVTAFQMETV